VQKIKKLKNRPRPNEGLQIDGKVLETIWRALIGVVLAFISFLKTISKVAHLYTERPAIHLSVTVPIIFEVT
jgi:uncharacterized protein YbbC (DUF1343 family)